MLERGKDDGKWIWEIMMPVILIEKSVFECL